MQLRVALVVAVLGCHDLPPAQPVSNIAAPQTDSPRADALTRARTELDRARRFARFGIYLQAYAAAQRGLNVLAGTPPDQDAELEAGTSKQAQDELVFMTESRTRELERAIAAYASRASRDRP